MLTKHLKSLLVFVALLQSTICLPGESQNVAVVFLNEDGVALPCVGFPVADNLVISSSNCLADRWMGRIKVLVPGAASQQLSADALHDADDRNVSGVFHHPSSMAFPDGGGNYDVLKLYSFSPAFRRTVDMSNATSWDDVGDANCTVTGFSRNGSIVWTVLNVGNVSSCWKDTAHACLQEASGAAVACGGRAVAIAVPQKGVGRPSRRVEFLGRYSQWVSNMTIKRFGPRETAANDTRGHDDDDDDDCDVPFWIQADERCAATTSHYQLAALVAAVLVALAAIMP